MVLVIHEKISHCINHDFFSSSAFSDFNWKLMGETKNADQYYIDLSSIEKDNNKRFYIRLRDYGITDDNAKN